MNSKKCAQCGLVNFESASECKRCNSPLGAAEASSNGHSSHATNNPPNNFHSTNNFHATSSFGGPAATNAGLYYKPSGDVTMAGMFGGLAGGLLVGALMAFAYSYIIYYVPLVYLNFLCTLGFGAGLGFAVGGIMRWGKVRNPALGAAFSFLVALGALYLSWAVWLSILLSTEDSELSALMILQHPISMWQTIVQVGEVGAWKMHNQTINGLLLWLVWAAEALTVVVGAPLMTLGALSADPFCESCQSWCKMEKGLLLINDAESAELKRRAEAKDFDYFKSIGYKKSDALNWYRLDLHQCAQCGATNTLSMHREKLTFDSKGNKKVSSSKLIELLMLSGSDVSNLQRVSHEVQEVSAQPQYA